jgi:E3 ubiquitin-protein ligase RNF115/126
MLMGQERRAGDRGAAVLGPGDLMLGDLFLGPGLDLLWSTWPMPTQSSWQNTPPARKKAVAALPTVRVREVFICYLDEVAVGG